MRFIDEKNFINLDQDDVECCIDGKNVKPERLDDSRGKYNERTEKIKNSIVSVPVYCMKCKSLVRTMQGKYGDIYLKEQKRELCAACRELVLYESKIKEIIFNRRFNDVSYDTKQYFRHFFLEYYYWKNYSPLLGHEIPITICFTNDVHDVIMITLSIDECEDSKNCYISRVFGDTVSISDFADMADLLFDSKFIKFQGKI